MAWSSLTLSFSSLSFCRPSSSSLPLFSRSIRSLLSRLSRSWGSSVANNQSYYQCTSVWQKGDCLQLNQLIHTQHFPSHVLEHPSLLPLLFQQPSLLLCLLLPSFQSLSFSLCFGQELRLSITNERSEKKKSSI